ncbi:unnamed protein product [Protopolystoma xenopodis]|uniref:Uncharacterized protein n=1 Tax=Protopolystoma xenopodis TaxID=117903 RepID=A0A448WVY5_9PLAT|nr:unnamed protein product [Protopolystoma xenopodis]
MATPLQEALTSDTRPKCCTVDTAGRKQYKSTLGASANSATKRPILSPGLGYSLPRAPANRDHKEDATCSGLSLTSSQTFRHVTSLCAKADVWQATKKRRHKASVSACMCLCVCVCVCVHERLSLEKAAKGGARILPTLIPVGPL